MTNLSDLSPLANMSDALEKVKGLTHLPLFPLPVVVLPNEFLPLHIFEERYKQMLKDIKDQRNIFGVTYFDPDDSIADRPATETIGCAVEIRQVEHLPHGRANILTIGLVRYRLIDYIESSKPYFVGHVEYFEDHREDPSVVEPLADEVFNFFERMAKAAFKLGGGRGDLPEIVRSDPESLSFLIAAAFSFNNDKKYGMLEMTSTSKRLTQLKSLLAKTVVQMEESAEIQIAARSNGHSNKKIDL